MIKNLIKSTLALSLAATVAFGAQGVMFNVASGDAEEHYNTMINSELKVAGYSLSDPHERINDGYAEKYGSTNLDNLGFFSITNDKGVRELLLSNPEIGGFAPFNLHVYKLKAEDKTYVGHIMPETMMDIVGVEDKGVRAKFAALFPALDKLVQEKIGGEVKYLEYDKLSEKPMMKFEIEFERPEDLTEYIDEFQGEFEAKFEENKYIIAGYKNFKETYDDNELEFDRYDAYYVYSLCHFKFSEGIFNQGRPDAGVFAPCSMYMYVEEGSNKLMIGMPKLENWISVMKITDQKKVDAIRALDKEIISIMKELGAKEL
ncbi:MAG: hypothetical protein FP820_00010 [Sulfurimonas sp.]|jgi:uncharacterized protein (DUF302 family)|nr:hypothetical protein [Sulfurimonas sp.]MBU1217789.1 hypothetical protein [bacterium]MBU1434183.1 hypothetical protein [bacterium]MBU1504278.1 hypothetical protein [bacterium]MBU3939391.1 hypothetical protein [bacterium]